MARVGQLEASVGRVVDGVDAGDDRDVLKTADELVGIGQHVGRREVLDGIAAYGGPHLAHQRGRRDTAPHDIADDDRDPPRRQRDEVVPVATHLADGWQVASRSHDTSGRGQCGEQAVLQDQRPDLLAGDRLRRHIAHERCRTHDRPRLIGQAEVGDLEGAHQRRRRRPTHHLGVDERLPGHHDRT